MVQDRREFLKGTAWMGAAAVAAGCMSDKLRLTGGGSMSGFRVAPMKEIRVGVVGLGGRGRSAVNRIALIPGVRVTGLCDIKRDCIDTTLKNLEGMGRKFAGKTYCGDENEWKRMAEADDVDLVYVVTPIDWHRPMACYSMLQGKHALVEVCACTHTDECWEIVETCEKTRRHCMMLENCCYGETELLSWNLCRQGILGDIVHAEAGYIHDCRSLVFSSEWRMKRRLQRRGNQYPTHGLGPVAQCMNINCGDRFDYLISVESRAASLGAYARAKYPAGSWQAGLPYEDGAGDMNTTVVRTAKGNTIMLQYATTQARPYSRIDMLCGTKGIFWGQPTRHDKFRVAFEETIGDKKAEKMLDEKAAEAVGEKYRHPLWKDAGAVAAKVGGHGGMDFLMDLRWAYCLQNGLPLDMDVYDLASWSCIYELSEKSVRSRSQVVDIPDFTRGGWQTAKPKFIGGIDLSKMGFKESEAKADKAALNV